MPGYYITGYGMDHAKINQVLYHLSTAAGFSNTWLSFVPVVGLIKQTSDSINDTELVSNRTPTYSTQAPFMNHGLYLGWTEFTGAPPSHPSITGNPTWSVYGTGYRISQSYSPYLPWSVELRSDGFQTASMFNLGISKLPSGFTPAIDSLIGVQISDVVGISGAIASAYTGVKASFYTAQNIADAFEDPLNMRKTLYVGTPKSCKLTGVCIAADGSSMVTGVTSQMTTAHLLSYKSAVGNIVPAAFWADVMNPAKTYTDLWTTYPTVMPNTVSQVYAMREWPSINTGLTTLNSGLTAMTAVQTTGNTSVSTLNTHLSNIKTSLDTKFDALNTSIVAGNTLDTTRNTTLTATNTSLGSLQTALTTQLGNLKTAADLSTTQLTSMNTGLVAISTAMEGVETAIDITGGHLSLSHADMLALKTALDTGNTTAATQNTTLQTLKTSLDAGNTANGVQTAAIQAMAIGLGNAFDTVFGVNGSLIQVMQSSGPNQANIVALMAMVSQGATVDQIRTAYPLEGFLYAKEIDLMRTLSSDRLTLATSALISAMQASGSAGNLIPIITEYPELLLHAGDIITMDRWMKTGISS